MDFIHQLPVLSDAHLLRHPLHYLQRLVRTWDTGLPCCAVLLSWAPCWAEQNHWTAPGVLSCPANLGDTETNQQKSLGVNALPSAQWLFCLVAKYIHATKKKICQLQFQIPETDYVHQNDQITCISKALLFCIKKVLSVSIAQAESQFMPSSQT